MDSSSRWLRRTNLCDLKLDLRLAGRGHFDNRGCVVVGDEGRCCWGKVRWLRYESEKWS